jgi:hypothetical protein
MLGRAPAAHPYNPSYSGGSDQGSKFEASSGKEFERPYHKIGLVEWLKVTAPLSSSPRTAKKRKFLSKVFKSHHVMCYVVAAPVCYYFHEKVCGP